MTLIEYMNAWLNGQMIYARASIDQSMGWPVIRPVHDPFPPLPEDLKSRMQKHIDDNGR